MTTKHTPGPWRVGGELVSATNGGNVTEIASVWSRRTERRDAPAQSIADANARLIAAAPELLAALTRLLAAFETDAMVSPAMPIQTSIETNGMAIQVARAALAKVQS